MKRTFGLIRISSTTQSEKNGGTGLEFQRNKITQYAELNDFNLVSVLDDVCSGGLSTRSGVEKLKHHVSNGEVDVVLICNDIWSGYLVIEWCNHIVKVATAYSRVLYVDGCDFFTEA